MAEARIDKWLWAVRVFKTRTVATDACKKGRVLLNDAPAKPSRTVKPGDMIKVRKPPVTYSFLVKDTVQNRLEVVKISGFIDRRKGLGRPTKREGRELSRFTADIFDSDGWDFDDLDDDTDDYDSID